MSYPRFYDQLPTRRFATAFGGRAAAANYHGVEIARLLATKMGVRPSDVLPLMARPLAREASRALGCPATSVLADMVLETRSMGARNGR